MQLWEGEKRRRRTHRGWVSGSGGKQGRELWYTFHVALALEDDEGVAAAAAVLVAHDPHPFDAPVVFEFAAKVVFGRGLVLWEACELRSTWGWRRVHTRREMKSVL